MTKATCEIVCGQDGKEVLVEVKVRMYQTPVLRMEPKDIATWQGLEKRVFSNQSKFGHRIATDSNFAHRFYFSVFILAVILLFLQLAFTPYWWYGPAVSLQMMSGVAIAVSYFFYQSKKRKRLVREARDALLRKNGHEGIDSDTVWPHTGLDGWNHQTCFVLLESEAEGGE